MKTLLMALAFTAAATGTIKVELASSVRSPQPVGTVLGLIPTIEVNPPGPLNYRYSVRVNKGPFRVVRDFSQDPFFAWSPELKEHEATVRITVRNGRRKRPRRRICHSRSPAA